MIRQYELVERVKAYDPGANEDALNRAYVFAMMAHGNQTRASGDPYFSHPLEVAGILTELRLDTGSIVTALLHDTVEDTTISIDDIRDKFGEEIARLVDGVTKLTRLELRSEETKQAENFRKLVLAMSEDIRVLLVKLADRVHNMRTLYHLNNPEKRTRIARETLEIYAPLAERIGIHQFKDELEDIAFGELYPDAKEGIKARLSFLREAEGGIIPTIIDELSQTLKIHGVPCIVSGREKSPYSIWRKMRRKNVSFEQLSDIMAFRVIVDAEKLPLPQSDTVNLGDDDISLCYQTLGVIHAEYPVVPGRFKDYISTPKPNGYRSIHTGVLGPERHRIEVQIRSREMHEVAELGVAAHWSYKQGASTAGRQFRWIRELLDILEHAQPEEFLEHTKLELFQDKVYCFTPKGDLHEMPAQSTSVDFAYAVHSVIGDRCVGAKINGRIMPLRTILQNGDQVEVMTSKTGTPSPDWLDFVATGKAKARIRRFIRLKQREQHAELGRQMLQRVWRQEGYDFTEKAIDGVLKIFKQPAVEDLMAAVGAGIVGSREVFNTVFPGHRTQPTKSDANVVPLKRAQSKKQGKDKPLAIKGLIPGMAVHYARCCHPLPGDRIVGIVTTGKGVSIHTIDCETLETFAQTPERWLDVAWEADVDREGEHVGRITVIIANEPGALGTLSTVIGKNGGNITNLKITSRTLDYWEMLIDIKVNSVKQLTNLIAALRATPVINAVDRAVGR